MPQLTCPPRKTLLGWAEGELLPSDSESLETHVANCSKCQIELSEEDSADPIVRALQPVSFVDTSRDCDLTLSAALQTVKRQRETHRSKALTAFRCSYPWSCRRAVDWLSKILP